MPLPKYLYHYYEQDSGPFRNITTEGFDKAKQIQKSITAGWNSKRPDTYIDLRFALERRLKAQFLEKGGKPTRDDPFYFTLGPCEWVTSWYLKPAVIKIPLAEFDPNHLSFTYPDSMVSYQFHDEPKLKIYRKACNGRLFLLEEMEALVQTYGLPSHETSKTEEHLKYDKYIEAQVWDASVVASYKLKAVY
jgi:hypothetical protein